MLRLVHVPRGVVPDYPTRAFLLKSYLLIYYNARLKPYPDPRNKFHPNGARFIVMSTCEHNCVPTFQVFSRGWENPDLFHVIGWM